jgi:hypothetical protein
MARINRVIKEDKNLIGTLSSGGILETGGLELSVKSHENIDIPHLDSN